VGIVKERILKIVMPAKRIIVTKKKMFTNIVGKIMEKYVKINIWKSVSQRGQKQMKVMRYLEGVPV